MNAIKLDHNTFLMSDNRSSRLVAFDTHFDRLLEPSRNFKPTIWLFTTATALGESSPQVESPCEFITQPTSSPAPSSAPQWAYSPTSQSRYCKLIFIFFVLIFNALLQNFVKYFYYQPTLK
ncbi:MAG: hypothetical protein EBV51_05550 [Acidimicrobiia bacterium]|nr:hypothetical protein [Acidimicrobiia bacterium]